MTGPPFKALFMVSQAPKPNRKEAKTNCTDLDILAHKPAPSEALA
jgi:hypothetical protein